MAKTLLRFFKRSLTSLGAALPDRALHQLQMLLNYMRLGRWTRRMGFRFAQRFPQREQVFAVAAERIKEKRVLYLEFGVYTGSSMRWWSAALQHPEAQLHGFDSFEGLPEAYDDAGGKYTKGWFSTRGQVPQIDDPRITFHKGWFEQTLPEFELPAHEILLINLDADLYSSTSYVLEQLRPHIRAGVYVYFDDMSRPDHEPRALEEFLVRSGLTLRPLAADVTLNNALFVCAGSPGEAA
ncbi:MAG: class I SAM-dependent methyltransferase [Anaerolineales bacterium]|nr:class I SAM-dependent methyltransferase [Anaerolineales bacterium]